MAAQPVAGIKPVRVPRRAHRAARTAELEVRFGAIELRAPKTRAKLPNVRLWAVWARELNAPAGVEPVEWMLLTTLAVENFEQACQKLDWYTRAGASKYSIARSRAAARLRLGNWAVRTASKPVWP